MILGKVGPLDARTPFDRPLIRLFQPGQNLKQHRYGPLISAEDRDPVILPDRKAHLVQQAYAVYGLAHIGDEQPVFARLPVGLEPDPGVTPSRSGQFLHRDLLQQLPARRRLP